jgi:dolichol-phosphate mannosyltransferase
MNAPDYSVVILCYQAGEYTISFTSDVVDNLNTLNIDYEIILVANYWENTDDITPNIAKELRSKNPRIKVVALPKEGMMGWDLISGLKMCTGKVIAIIDGDGQMLPYDLVRCYKELKDKKLDFVKTYREIREDSLSRIIISIGFNIIFRLLFPGLPLRDINSKPKVFTREVYGKLNLTATDWFLDAEMMLGVRRLGLKVGEIPTIFKQINTRESYINFSAVLEFIKNLAKARVNEFLKRIK